MNAPPRVSVIMPFLNAERFIDEAIESVVAQSYPHWELLLVDDGSSDGSTAIAQRFVAQYPGRIRYLEHERHENRGASASRNLGLLHARGAYIAFLDADDVYLPHKLAEQVPLLDAHPEAGLLYGSTEYWYSWLGEEEARNRDSIAEPRLTVNRLYRPPELLVRLLLREQGTVPCTCSLLVRREAMQQIEGFENDFRYIYTDQVLYAKLFLSVPVFVANGCWDRYRQHPDSCCHVVERTGQQANARLRFLKWLQHYVAEHMLDSSALQRDIRRAQWLVGHPAIARILRGIRRRFPIISRRSESDELVNSQPPSRP